MGVIGLALGCLRDSLDVANRVGSAERMRVAVSGDRHERESRSRRGSTLLLPSRLYALATPSRTVVASATWVAPYPAATSDKTALAVLRRRRHSVETCDVASVPLDDAAEITGSDGIG